MRSQQTTTRVDALTDGVRYLAREVLREPIKDAVKEALREEAAVSESDERRATDRRSDEDSDESGGLPVGMLLVGLTAATGLAYAVRKRGGESEQSTWSEFDEESDIGTGRSEQTEEPGPSTTD